MKTISRHVGYAVSLLVFFMFSCSDPGIMPTVETDIPPISIQSLEHGRVLSTDDVIYISLTFDLDMVLPDLMVVELLTESEQILFTQELGEEEINQLPYLFILPDEIEPDRYILSVRVYQEGEILAERTSVFFLTTEAYEIIGVTPYPQFFYPGGKGLLVANLDIPENTDSYLKWIFEDETILEGYVMDGTDIVQISVPDRDGVYSIKLELFPLGPDPANFVTFEYSSSVALEAQVFVSSNQSVDTVHELYPEENYYSLFHFRGEFGDWGYGDAEASIVEIGNPTLAVLDGLFGFYLDGSTGFQIDQVIVPTVDGYLQPFSISSRFAVTNVENANSLLTILTDEAEPYSRLGFNEEGDLRFNIGDAYSILSGSYLTAGMPRNLTISIVPDAENIRFLWFVDGLYIHDDTVPYTAPLRILKGTSIIGGQEGFTGIIDELGIFYVQGEDGPKLDTEIFSRAMKRKFGNDYVFAEGFDGLSLPDQANLTFDGDADGIEVDGNRLLLPPTSQMQLKEIPIAFDSLSLELEYETPAPVTATLSLDSMDSGSELFTYRFDGTVLLPGNDTFTIEPLPTLRFDFIQTDAGLEFVLNQSSIFIGPIAESDFSISIAIESSSESLGLVSMLITKNRVQLLEQ